MEKTYQSSFTEIIYDKVNGWIYANWKGYQTQDTILKGFEDILQIMKSNECWSIINDNTLVVGTWAQASEWVGNIWFQKSISAGLKNFAWIYSPDPFGKFSMQRAIDYAGLSPIQTFYLLGDAEEWLKRVR